MIPPWKTQLNKIKETTLGIDIRVHDECKVLITAVYHAL